VVAILAQNVFELWEAPRRRVHILDDLRDKRILKIAGTAIIYEQR
jgi:hypothetical protein